VRDVEFWGKVRAIPICSGAVALLALVYLAEPVLLVLRFRRSGAPPSISPRFVVYTAPAK
jgi:hypothetical protein